MRAQTWMIAGLVIAAIGLALVLLADEKVENVAETLVVREPDGEWIRSVPGDSAEVWAVGDADPPASKRVVRLIRGTDPDRILYLGDVYQNGTAAQFERWAKPWGTLIQRMAPTPGNHEWRNARVGYNPFWREITGETPPSFYSFNAGGWEILAVNSEQIRWRPARSWLREQVEPGGNCRIAFWHAPRRSAGHHPTGPRRVDRFWDALAGRARLVVNGHDHNSQRLREQDGIVEYIAGAGGRKLYEVDESDKQLAFSNDTNYAALRLTLSPGVARWRFVAVGGTVLDSGSLRCRA
jgi:hypothetical protein